MKYWVMIVAQTCFKFKKSYTKPVKHVDSVYQNSWPPPLWPQYLYTQNKYWWGKSQICIKKASDIYFMKQRTWKADAAKIILAINYFDKPPKCICLTGFWICVGFWIFQGFEYARVAQNMPEYTWIIPEYDSLCLNMSEFDGLCMNMNKSVSYAFVLHLPIVIPCLLERVFIYFNYSHKKRKDRKSVSFDYVSTKFIFWRKMRLFS